MGLGLVLSKVYVSNVFQGKAVMRFLKQSRYTETYEHLSIAALANSGLS